VKNASNHYHTINVANSRSKWDDGPRKVLLIIGIVAAACGVAFIALYANCSSMLEPYIVTRQDVRMPGHRTMSLQQDTPYLIHVFAKKYGSTSDDEPSMEVRLHFTIVVDGHIISNETLATPVDGSHAILLWLRVIQVDHPAVLDITYSDVLVDEGTS